MWGDLFKSKRQRELEAQAALRRADRAFEQSRRKLERQREHYFVLGRAAARNGSRDKVRLIARAIRKCNLMEAQIDRARTMADLLRAQADIAHVKGEFTATLEGARSVLADTRNDKALVEIELAREAAGADMEEIEALVDAMMSGPAAMADADEAADLRELETAMMEAGRPPLTAATTATVTAPAEAATAAAPAAQEEDPILRDLRELEKELNLAQQ